MAQHLIEDAVWQRMLAALETVPYMHCRDLGRLRCFISACFVVMRTNLMWPQDFGQGDKLVPLERETGRDGQSDTQALRG